MNREGFETALFKARISEDDFSKVWVEAVKNPHGIIHLPPDYAIQFLNGLQGIKAARRFLDNNDKWWIVNLCEESSGY